MEGGGVGEVKGERWRGEAYPSTSLLWLGFGIRGRDLCFVVMW